MFSERSRCFTANRRQDLKDIGEKYGLKLPIIDLDHHWYKDGFRKQFHLYQAYKIAK